MSSTTAQEQQQQHCEVAQLVPEDITVNFWSTTEATPVVNAGSVAGIVPCDGDHEADGFVVVAHQSDKEATVKAWLVQRHLAAAFILSHTDAILVTYNANGTFNELLEACRAVGQEDAAAALVALVDCGRFRDVAVLDALVMLAERGKKVITRKLCNIAAEHLTPDRAARETARERLQSQLDEHTGASSAAIRAFLCDQVFWVLSERANACMEPLMDQFLPFCRERWGLLTDIIQVKAELALQQISDNGFTLDLDQLDAMVAKTEARAAQLVRDIDGMEHFAQVFVRSKAGKVSQSEGCVRPEYNRERLTKLLQEIATECRQQADKHNSAIKAAAQPQVRKLEEVPSDSTDFDEDEACDDDDFGATDEEEEQEQEQEEDEEDEKERRGAAGVPYRKELDPERELEPSEWFVPFETDKTADEKKKSKPQQQFVSWKTAYRQHPFVVAWGALARCTRQHRHLMALKRLAVPVDAAAAGGARLGVVHAKYDLMTRNGRTRTSAPNIQTTPVGAGFREMFVAPPGHVFVTLDYSCIELCTLAAVCQARYGFSKLGDVIRSGTDPHCFTAAMLCGLALEDFMRLRTSSSDADRQRFAQWRQKAKAVNFGIPGGLGAYSLREYAQSSFGVHMTLGEAQRLQERFVEAVYPELARYLGTDLIALLARNTHNSYELTWRALWHGRRTEAVARAIRQVVLGQPVRRNGTAFKDVFVQAVWRGLRELCSNTRVCADTAALVRKLSANAARNEYTEESLAEHRKLARELFTEKTVTLCGRVRARASYTRARNTPFSGLAADGAKLALWNITAAGYRIVAFIHDEMVVALPATDHVRKDVETIRDIAVRTMQELMGDITVSCSLSVSREWSKHPVELDWDTLRPVAPAAAH